MLAAAMASTDAWSLVAGPKRGRRHQKTIERANDGTCLVRYAIDTLFGVSAAAQGCIPAVSQC